MLTLQKVHRKPFYRWPYATQVWLRSLSFGDNGCIYNHLESNPMTFVIFQGEQPVAWAIHSFKESSDIGETFIYVREGSRQLGLGTLLLNQIIWTYNKCILAAWDDTSYIFACSIKEQFPDGVDRIIKYEWEIENDKQRNAEPTQKSY